jgi:acyl-CoA synthetase (AMP-forming)/AMP-acid ligase II
VAKQEPTFVERLRRHAAERPERVALRVLDKAARSASTEPASRAPEVRQLTYAELDLHARAVAAHLQSRAGRGERALILLPTSVEYVTAFLGALYAGAVAVPAYPPESQRRQHLDRVAGLARDCQPRFVVTSQREAPRLRELIALVPQLQAAELVVIDALDDALATHYDFAAAALTPDALAFLQYTSGSLSSPKGVMVSHGNLVANERAIQTALAFREDDVMISWLPLFHDMGLIGGLLQPLFAGASAVLMSPLRFLERPLRWLEAISSYGGTVSGGPDFAFRMCVDRIEPAALEKLDLRGWRVAFCGSEPVRASTLRAFSDRFAPAGFSASALYPCYGLAEATLLVSGVQPGSGMRLGSPPAGRGRALVSCGIIPPEHTVAILDPETLAELPAGANGEIFVSGPSIAAGYYGNTAATDAAFVSLEGRRFLRTGDLGFTRDGELYISGRLKDLVIVRGRNVVPQDIEDYLASSIAPLQIGRISVFPVQTEDGEAIGVAAEVSRATARTMRAELLCQAISAAVHECVDAPAYLVALLAHGTLPRTSSGKLQRSACAARLQSGALVPLAVSRAGVLQPSAAAPLEAL